MTSLNPSLRLALINKIKAKKKQPEKGFTLIELLITVVILGILSAIALPAFLNQQNRAAASALDAAAMAEARSCAALQVTAETDLFSGTLGNCEAAGTASTFTATDADGRASDAVATVGTDGSIELTTASIPVGGGDGGDDPADPADPADSIQ